MTNKELQKLIRILERKLLRSEESRRLIEEALESHILALKMTNIELLKSHRIIKSSEEKFKKLALYDPLTQLPTRTLLYERLERAMYHAKRGDLPLAILFVDLDKFKQINDTYGHDAGDAVLKEVSARIVASVRSIDTVARLSGDEFVILLEALKDRTDIEVIADRIMFSVSQYPIDFHSVQIQASLSIGISVFPADGELLDDLLKAADHAMYTIKKRDGNGWAFYSDVKHTPIST